ncbi:glycosyltransferase family 2 protein [Chitinivibrio alkaliphilus]|uniref:Glycosyltransferase family A n=1 Tax=Chitinivibrio alkaliphilus ACht1 TaxID=1313304 RepID=U7D691_9BACT|nr:glycosyltransferase family 2 protein [Chitinivibrio alkaliphilus]ERP31091.1 Glycosyltransferase family A [Chitinivibrio alkaliphilus ACht1]
MNTPVVSIITPAYNCADVVAHTIASIQAQTFQNWELCITDDCSTDTTMDILRAAAKKDPRIRVFQLEKNSGAAVARNNSIKKSRGRYIAFLDADDLWTPDKLEKQLAYMKEEGHAFTYTHYSVIDDGGNDLPRDLRFPERVSHRDLLRTCSIGCLTVMIDRTAFTDISMPLLRRGQDYALWLKLLKEVDHAWCVPANLARYRIGEHSLSRNKFKKLRGQWYIYRRIEGISVAQSLYYIAHYTWHGIRKNK